MTIEATATRTLAVRKLQLIEQIITTENEALLLQLEALLLSTKNWWDELSEAQRQSLQRGLDDARNGRVYPFEEVMSEVRPKHQI